MPGRGGDRGQPPGLRWAIGYPFALGLMALAMIAAITYFRRKGWF